MTSLHIWLTLAVWFALPIAIGKVLHKLNPTGDDDAPARRPAWDDVADLEAFLAQHPDNTGIRRATR